MKKIVYLSIITLLLPAALSAQLSLPYGGRIEVIFPDYVKHGDRVTFSATIDVSALELNTNQRIEFLPTLRSTRTEKAFVFEPVVISGKQREKLMRRARHFHNRTAEQPALVRIPERKGTLQPIPWSVTLTFEKWMRHAELVLTETATGCRQLGLSYGNEATQIAYSATYRFPESYQPVYTVSYIIPEVEPVKVMSDTYSAQLAFQVNRSTLLPEFGNNAAVLAQADRMIENIRNDTLLTVKSIRVAGYASPEGNEAANLKLSSERAEAFVNYLKDKNEGLSRMASWEGMGEDWQGLKTAVETSDLADRQAILAVIESTENANSRKNSLKKLSGGRTWRILLEEYFPPLRRNEYTIQYEVRGFNAEEARMYVWTRPQLLSLNEFFMAARLYAPTSREYKEIFDIAARIYPDSPVAQFNTGASEVENGAYASAINRLRDIDTPESRNNLGIAYWHEGDYEKAGECFRQAAQAGLPDAVENLRQYRLWFEDKD